MSDCCRCRRKGVSYGWMAFWCLVLFLVFAPNSNQQSASVDASQFAELSDQRVAEQMSVSCTPSQEQDKAMERLLTEMEEQGRRLSNI